MEAQECETVATAVGLADLSVFSKFLVTGSSVPGFLDALGANRAPRPGRVGLIHLLTPAGGVLSEFCGKNF